ncbi:MAG TPA: thiamine-phosphate kinase [Burkholderiales bacterium]|nr:thiamine-phosphate kinase [Burkholderiales bacterium]
MPRPKFSEFALIARHFTHPAPHAVLGVGDDAALLRPAKGMELAVSADMLVAGQHFYHDADAAGLGHKSLAVNLSDMAAMGAKPRWVLLSLALPAIDERWIARFARGFMRLARTFDVDLVGGDTTRGPLTISVQIIGEVPAGRALRRDGAGVGDDVWVSGALGDAALAVAAGHGRVRLNDAERRACARRLERPAPRIDLGIALRGIATAAIDISDGLIADLGHIAERSEVSAVVDFAQLPHSRTMARHLANAAARKALLAGGDDYELCFTAPATRRRAVTGAGRRAGIAVTRIGRIAAAARGGSVTALDHERPLQLQRGGFDHFS